MTEFDAVNAQKKRERMIVPGRLKEHSNATNPNVSVNIKQMISTDEHWCATAELNWDGNQQMAKFTDSITAKNVIKTTNPWLTGFRNAMKTFKPYVYRQTHLQCPNADCGELLDELESRTKYYGMHFGKYRCPKKDCNKTWTSAYAFDRDYQKCRVVYSIKNIFKNFH